MQEAQLEDQEMFDITHSEEKKKLLLLREQHAMLTGMLEQQRQVGIYIYIYFQTTDIFIYSMWDMLTYLMK